MPSMSSSALERIGESYECDVHPVFRSLAGVQGPAVFMEVDIEAAAGG